MLNEFRLLRVALALAHYGTFARAAEALNLSQPSVSRGIAELERSLGVVLFDRTRKGIVPTLFGRVLLERGERLVQDAAGLRMEIQVLAGLEMGSLVVAAGPYSGETTVPRALARVLRDHPRLRIRLSIKDPDEVVQDVLAGRADVGVADVLGLEQETRIAVEVLPHLRTYLACRPGHPLTRERKVTLARILDFPLATTLLRGPAADVASQGTGGTVVGDLRKAAFSPQITVSSLQAGRLIARGSDALFAAPASFLADDVATRFLVRVDFDHPVLQTTYGILHLADRSLAPAQRVFMDALRAEVAEARKADTAVPARPVTQ